MRDSDRVGLRLRFNCPSKLSDNSQDTLAVDLKFASFAYFGPKWVAQQIPELRILGDTRRSLIELKESRDLVLARPPPPRGPRYPRES